MKKLIYLLLMILSIGSYGQHINVSTGAGATASGMTDANWKVGITLPANGPAFTISTYFSFWEPTPVAGTGARWINIVNNYSTPGPQTYIYERKFSVAPGTRRLKYDFKVSADDALSSIEIIKPNSSVITLNAGFISHYKLSKPIIDSIDCPQEGNWIIRAKVLCADKGSGPSGFILSGYVNLIAGEGCVSVNYDPCCPPWNADILKKSMVYKGIGSIADPYTLVFQPDVLYQNQMQAYINYLHAINSSITTISTEFRIHNQGTGALPSTSGWGPMIGNIGYCKYVWNTTGVSSLTPASPINFFPAGSMIVGTWYAVQAGTYLNNNIRFFSDDCANTVMYVRIQVLGAKQGAANLKQANKIVMEVSNGKEIISVIPMQ